MTATTEEHTLTLSLWIEFDGQKVRLKNGKAKIKVNDPKLWWVRGYGDQYLYDLKVILVKYGKEIDVVNKRIGLRTLTVSTVPDKWGNEFCFVLNGIINIYTVTYSILQKQPSILSSLHFEFGLILYVPVLVPLFLQTRKILLARISSPTISPRYTRNIDRVSLFTSILLQSKHSKQ